MNRKFRLHLIPFGLFGSGSSYGRNVIADQKYSVDSALTYYRWYRVVEGKSNRAGFKEYSQELVQFSGPFQ